MDGNDRAPAGGAGRRSLHEGEGRARGNGAGPDAEPGPARANDARADEASADPIAPAFFKDGLWTYALRPRWRAQAGLALLALLAAALNLGPVELQRRMIDNAIGAGDAALLLTLAGVYAAALLAHKATKYALSVGQAALAERSAAELRLSVSRALERQDRAEEGGEAASILSAETDKLGGFVGGGPTAAIRDAAMLLGLAGYMLWTSPPMAAAAFAMLIPQALIAPLLQLRLNRLVKRRLELLRELTEAAGQGDAETRERLVEEIRRNRMRFSRLKAMLKQLLNLMNAAAPLAVLLIGGLMVLDDAATLGVVVAFASGVERVSGPLRDLVGFYRRAAQAVVQHVMIRRWLEGGEAG